MSAPDLYGRTLARAAMCLGGADALAAHLGVSAERLAGWLYGGVPIPVSDLQQPKE